MNQQLSWFLFFLFLFTMLISITEVLHRKFHLKSENSRKFLHVTGGIAALCLPLAINNHWWVLLLIVITFIVLFTTYKRKMLNSVHQVKRNSVGSILFPVPVYLCFLFAEWQHNFVFYYIPISLLTFADTAAEIGGNNWGPYTKKFFNGQKTLAGSVCFFIVAILVAFLWLHFVFHIETTKSIIAAALIAITTTFTELITLGGWDNLSIPFIATISLYAMSCYYFQQ